MICTSVSVYHHNHHSFLLSFIIISSRLGYSIKTNCIKLQAADPEICLFFDFLERGLWLVSPPQLVYDFSRKILLLYSISWLNFIVSLSLLHYGLVKPKNDSSYCFSTRNVRCPNYSLYCTVKNSCKQKF